MDALAGSTSHAHWFSPLCCVRSHVPHPNPNPNPTPSPTPTPNPSPNPNAYPNPTLIPALTLPQALAHWFGGVSRPAALQHAFRGHSLLPLGAPTELDLELLSRSQLVEQPAALHSTFGAALGDAAAAVAGGLAPLPQVSADGASLGAWASLVTDWLNRESE